MPRAQLICNECGNVLKVEEYADSGRNGTESLGWDCDECGNDTGTWESDWSDAM